MAQNASTTDGSDVEWAGIGVEYRRDAFVVKVSRLQAVNCKIARVDIRQG